MTSIDFHCRTCGDVAGTVTLVPSAAGAAHLSISGLMFQETTDVTGDRLRRLQAVLATGQARDLYDIEPLWASFFCPQCDCSYCKQHWTVSLQFDDDDDFPGWYDSARGVCPAGHERMVDD